jgi:tRNA pseudouridine38-40 synthase
LRYAGHYPVTTLRIALTIEYDGSAFSGWQLQNSRRTVQMCVEQALSKVADEPVAVVCAGRTDAGVHALEQVAHFDTSAQRNVQAWTLGANTYLPNDVRIIDARPVSDDFHARSSALARCYHYMILNRKVRSALLPRQTTWCHYPLDIEQMQQAAGYLIGEHDFSSFRARGCQSNSPRRRVDWITVQRAAERVTIEIVANAFLHHMVRNIVGVLMTIGAGKEAPEWALQVLLARDRSNGGVTAPPHGLHLVAVHYPMRFSLPRHTVFEPLPDNLTRFDEPDTNEFPIPIDANSR